jgi:hypothetical protein
MLRLVCCCSCHTRHRGFSFTRALSLGQSDGQWDLLLQCCRISPISLMSHQHTCTQSGSLGACCTSTATAQLVRNFSWLSQVVAARCCWVQYQQLSFCTAGWLLYCHLSLIRTAKWSQHSAPACSPCCTATCSSSQRQRPRRDLLGTSTQCPFRPWGDLYGIATPMGPFVMICCVASRLLHMCKSLARTIYDACCQHI